MEKPVTNIDLSDSFSVLHQLRQVQTGIIRSTYPTINGLEITFQKTETDFVFSTGPINGGMPGGPVKYQNDGNYGIGKPFDIIVADKIYRVPHGPGSNIVHMGQGFTTSGTFWELDGMQSAEPDCFRAMLPMMRPMQSPLQYMLGESFKVGTSTSAFGLIKLEVDGIPVYLFGYDNDKIRNLIVEALSPITLPHFRKILEVLQFTYALITGSLVREELLITGKAGFLYEKLRGSIDSPFELISPRKHKEWFQLKTTNYLQIEVFSKLAHLCYNDSRIFRAVKIITQARDTPAELEISSHCVALETLKNVIVDDNKEDLLPIKDKTVAAGLIDRLRKIIEETDEIHFNNRGRVLNKLNGLNSVGNNESYYLAFEKAGFALTKEDKEYLLRRNQFLHGTMPSDVESKDDPHQFALHKISIHIQLLTCCLLLKLAGYKGPVMNFWKYWELQRGINNADIALFREI